MTACEIDPVDIYPTDPVAPAITDHSDIFLTEDLLGEMVTFSWSEARNIGDDVVYELDLTCNSLDFVLAEELAQTYFTMEKSELHNLLATAGAPEDENYSVTLTVVASSRQATLASAPVALNIVVVAPAEGGDEEPATEMVAHWSVIGEINGSSWDADVYMTAADGGLFVSPVFVADGGFKIRFNNDWAVNRGGNCATLGQPFAVVNNGDNIDVVSGAYYVVYNSVDEQMTVFSAVDGWGMIGDAVPNGWERDSYELYTASADVYKSYPVVFGEGGFKLRIGNDWIDTGNVGSGDSFTGFGTPFSVVNGDSSGNISTEGFAGWPVIVTFDYANLRVTIDKVYSDGRWSVIGNVNGCSWTEEIFMWQSGSVWKSEPFRVDGTFKLHQNAGWDAGNVGSGSVTALDTACPVVNSGDSSNITVGEDIVGKVVTLEYDPSASTITLHEIK